MTKGITVGILAALLGVLYVISRQVSPVTTIDRPKPGTTVDPITKKITQTDRATSMRKMMEAREGHKQLPHVDLNSNKPPVMPTSTSKAAKNLKFRPVQITNKWFKERQPGEAGIKELTAKYGDTFVKAAGDKK